MTDNLPRALWAQEAPTGRNKDEFRSVVEWYFIELGNGLPNDAKERYANTLTGLLDSEQYRFPTYVELYRKKLRDWRAPAPPKTYVTENTLKYTTEEISRIFAEVNRPVQT